ncbi:RNA recognition motif domain-containing protein [Ditylenchus destructor]|uniref:RNA recognition motif domain-containing protein n=1 Tax=Ditylenchus destructor TaxID=166010 RepID=A0AAD4R5A2_9BILA|nr:RNA recognition motif domain-containing protein [Ditylenchus destructor]
MDGSNTVRRPQDTSIIRYAILASLLQTAHWVLLWIENSEDSREDLYYAACFAAASVYLLLVYLWTLCVSHSEQWKRIQFNFVGVAVALAGLFLAKYIIFLVISTFQLLEKTLYARALLFIALIVFHTLCFFAYAIVALEGARRPRRCRQCGGWHCQSCAPQQPPPAMLDSGRALRLIYSYFRPLPIYIGQFSNNLRHFSALGPNFTIRSCDNCEENRNFCTLAIVKCHSARSEEKFLNVANLRPLTSQIYSRQRFYSSSGSDRFDDARSVFATVESHGRLASIIRNKQTGASHQFGYVELATVEEAEQASKEPLFVDCKEVSVIMYGNKEWLDKYRIFVGGLLKGGKETSRGTLHRYFSQFGDIFECHIVYNEDNLSKGFGYVTYKSQDSVDRALNSQPHSIDSQVVTVEHTPPRPRELTMFVGNLSPKTTDESLRKYFSKYGQLTQSEVKIDSKTGQSRGFGYVGFRSKEELERARAAHPHTIDGVEVSFHSKGQNLVVNSLPPNITEDSLRTFFSQYGQVQDCRRITNSVGRTTVFVTMSNEEETSRALADRPHYIKGKLVSLI